MAAVRADSARSEEGAAVFGAVMALSAASGGMVSAIEVTHGSLALVAVPTLVLLGALVLRNPTLPAYAATALWILMVPMAQGVAILAPLMMIVLCLAFAVGPERLMDWVRDEWTGRESTDRRDEAAWIEDDLTIR
jgi:hypothetical protein